MAKRPPPPEAVGHYLSPADIRGFTGAGTKEGATRCLRANGIPFVVRADQWPTTTWEALHRALSGGGSARPDATPPGAGDGFNLDALR